MDFMWYTLSTEPWAATTEASCWCGTAKQLLSRFLANGHLLQVSRQSRLSANDKGDEIKPGAVHISPGIKHYNWSKLQKKKPQLGGGLMKALQPVFALNWVLYLQMT